jgi:phosphoglycolate phosphatase
MVQTSLQSAPPPKLRVSDRPGVIFDLDGTLIDSAPDIHAAANKVLSAEGLPLEDFATVRGFIGNGVGVLVGRLLQKNGLPNSGPQHARMVQHFVDLYEDAHLLTSLYPGVLAALDALFSAGYVMAICTNKPEAPARSVLRHFGIDGYFSAIVGGDTLIVRKPYPAPLRDAKKRLGAARILFVGDSEVDAETAVAAAEPFVLFTEGYRKTPSEALAATATFDHFARLPAIVQQLLPHQA